MTTPYHRIGRNAHRLPRGYFADAPTLSPASQPVAGHNSPHGNTGASPELAAPAPADDTADGRQGVLSTAAHFARHASGVGYRAYAVAADRIARAQQLRAARIISGRAQG